MSSAARRRSAWTHFVIQNVSFLLALLLLVASLIVYVVLFYASQHRTPGDFEVTSIVNNAMPLVLAATGQTVVILTGGIDLSVGGMMDMTNSLTAIQMHNSPGSMLLWSAVVILIGAAGGLLNGLLVAFGRLQPILVTLATLSIFQGIAIKILPAPGGQAPPSLTSLLTNTSYPWALVYVALVIVLWLLFRRTPFGVAIFAIGNDTQAARANGVNVVGARIGAFVLAGILSALAGMFLAATTTGGDATTGDAFTLTSIAAVVLGGVSLFGGRGSAVGSIAGAFVLTLLINILFFANINPLYQSFYEGLFLIAAVVLTVLIGRYLRRVG